MKEKDLEVGMSKELIDLKTSIELKVKVNKLINDLLQEDYDYKNKFGRIPYCDFETREKYGLEIGEHLDTLLALIIRKYGIRTHNSDKQNTKP